VTPQPRVGEEARRDPSRPGSRWSPNRGADRRGTGDTGARPWLVPGRARSRAPCSPARAARCRCPPDRRGSLPPGARMGAVLRLARPTPSSWCLPRGCACRRPSSPSSSTRLVRSMAAERPHLLRPDPHHVLLLQARRLVRDGTLAPKRRPRIARALEEDPRPGGSRPSGHPLGAPARAQAAATRLRGRDLRDTLASRAALCRAADFCGSVQAAADLSFRSLSAKLIRPNRIVAISGPGRCRQELPSTCGQGDARRARRPSVIE